MSGTVVGTGYTIMHKIDSLLSRAENLVELSRYLKSCQRKLVE